MYLVHYLCMFHLIAAIFQELKLACLKATHLYCHSILLLVATIAFAPSFCAVHLSTSHTRLMRRDQVVGGCLVLHTHAMLQSGCALPAVA